MAITTNREAYQIIEDIRMNIPEEESVIAAFNEQAVDKTATPQIIGVSQFVFAYREELGASVLLQGVALLGYIADMSWWGFDEGLAHSQIQWLKYQAGTIKKKPSGPAPVPFMACNVSLPELEVVEEPQELDPPEELP